MELVVYYDQQERGKSAEMARIRRSLRDESNPLEMVKLNPGVPNILKLAATLRFCAQGSYQLSVGNDHNIGLAQSKASIVMKEVFKALEDTICTEWIKFEYTEAEMEEAKLAFYTRSGFPGTIGCIDGTHIRIVSPTKELQHLYYNRKGFYSLNAMIVCDHKMRIRYINAKHPGASHDSRVFQMSALARKLDAITSKSYWLLGDAGYALKSYLMTPFRNTDEGTLEREYNKKHASARSIIERTIGVLKNRFRCLLSVRGLHYTPEKATQIVNVCAALHNICIHYMVENPEININQQLNLDVNNGEEDQTVGTEGDITRRRIMLSFI